MGTVLDDLQSIRSGSAESDSGESGSASPRTQVMSDLEKIRSGSLKPTAPPPPPAPVDEKPESFLDRAGRYVKMKAADVGRLAEGTKDLLRAGGETVTDTLKDLRAPAGTQFEFHFPGSEYLKSIPFVNAAVKGAEMGGDPGTQEFVKGTPGVLGETAKDVGGIVAKAGAGFAKGATFGAVNAEEGTFGIPFTDIKGKFGVPLPDALESLGVSPEIARNQNIDLGPEFAGAVYSWGAVSRAIGTLVPAANAARTLAAGGEITKTARPFAAAVQRVLQEGATGEIVGRAQVRGPDEDPAVNAFHGAVIGMGGAVIGETINAAAKIYGLYKIRPLVELKNDISDLLYKSGAVETAEQADHQASRIVVKGIEEAGGPDKIPKENIAKARAKIKERLVQVAKNVTPAGEPAAPAEPAPQLAPPAAGEAQPPSEAPQPGGPLVPGAAPLAPAGAPPVPAAPAAGGSANVLDSLDKIRSGVSPTPPETPATQPDPAAVAPKPTGSVLTGSLGKPSYKLVDPLKTATGVIDKRAQYPILTQIRVKDGEMATSDQQIMYVARTDKADGMYQVIGKNLEKSAFRPEDFPALPATKEVLGKVDKNDLILNLERADRSTSTDETRAVLMHTLLDVKDGKAVMVATDGRQLSSSDLNVKGMKDGQYLLPAAGKLANALKGVDGDTLTIKRGEGTESNALSFEGKGARVYVAMDQGNFPNYQLVTPTLSSQFQMPRAELDRAMKELRPYIKANGAESVRVDANDNGVTISTKGPAADKAITVPAKMVDNLGYRPSRGTIAMPMKMDPGATSATTKSLAINPNFISNALANVRGDTVYMGLRDHNTPAHFYGKDLSAETPAAAETTEPAAPTRKRRVPAGSAKASVDAFADIPNPPPSNPTFAGAMTDELPPAIELPELTMLASDLMGGSFPHIVEKIRAAGGTARGAFYPGKGEIKLRANLFKDATQAAKTLAHEVGHLIDWLPDKVMGRGNVLGRMMTLKKFMKGSFEELYNAKEIKDELKRLTQIWKPFDEKQDISFTKYRYSSEELYADALSVLFNNPKLLRETAPKFYKGFFEYLDRKPLVKQAYADLIESIKNGGALPNREKNIREMFTKGEANAAAERRKSVSEYRTVMEEAKYELIDKDEAIQRAVKEAGKVHSIDPDRNPVFALEEMHYAGSEVKAWLAGYDRIIDGLKEVGLTWEDLGEALFHDRVINERSELANPLGFTPDTSARQLQYIREKVGPEKWAALQKTTQDFRDSWNYVIHHLEASNMLAPETMAQIKSNPYYATFDVFSHHIEAAFGPTISAKVMHQIGTLNQISNPATATLMKGVSLLKTINKKFAAASTTDFLAKEFGSSSIQPAEMEFTGRGRIPKEPGDNNKGMIAFMEGGKVKAYYVDKYIAKSFQRDPVQAKLIINVLRGANVWFREIFVQSNPGFMAFNAIRDFLRAAKNLPASGPDFLKGPKAVGLLTKYYLQNLKPAFRRGFGIDDPLIEEMLRRKILITVESKWGINDEDKQVEALMARYSESGMGEHNPIVKPFVQLFHTMKAIGSAVETMPKVAGYQYLKDHQAALGLSDKELDHMIRAQIGSPNFLAQGGAYSLYNNIFLFSNSIKEGIRGDFEVLRDRPAEFWWKTAQFSIIPKLLMYAMSLGLAGAGIKDIMDSASDYDKSNYFIVPLGKDENGKGVYFRVPLDETGRFLSGLMWKFLMMPQQHVRNFANLFDYMAGQAPTLSPTIGMVADVLQYASGKNPYDWFRGKNAIPDQSFQANDWHTTRDFLKYMANQGGASIIYKFQMSDVDRIKGSLEKIIDFPLINNLAGRFIKVSDFGKYEQMKQVSQEAAQEKARTAINEEEVIADNINANDQPTVGTGLKLYAEMLKDGQLRRQVKTMSPKEFLSKYQRMTDKKSSDPYVNAVVFAASQEEKAALVNYYKQTMPDDKYKAILGKLLIYDHLSPSVLVGAEMKSKATKK